MQESLVEVEDKGVFFGVLSLEVRRWYQFDAVVNLDS